MLFWASRLFDGFSWSREALIELGDGGRIRRISETSRPPSSARRLEVVMPSLVNAHVHLELGALPLPPQGRGFLPWVGEVIRARLRAGPGELGAQARNNLRTLREGGTGSLSEVDSMGFGAKALAEEDGEGASFPTRCDAEVLGFALGEDEARALCEERLASLPAVLEKGLSPHAPYSVSIELFKEAASMGVPLSIHVSETPEEVEFCERGTGPFRELLLSLGKLPASFSPPGCSPLAHLDRLGLLGEESLLIHVQELRPGDLEILERSGSPVVLCPGTIQYFGRPAPAYSSFRERGILCALGTDSLASNERLDMFAELHRFHRMFPEVPGTEVLSLGTSMGGKAIGIPGAGRLREGDPFDALGFSDFPQGMEEETTDILLSGRIPPFILYARGRTVL